MTIQELEDKVREVVMKSRVSLAGCVEVLEILGAELRDLAADEAE